MADDGKAKIVLSAEDRTKAAFESAKKNLRELQEKAEGVGAHFGTIGAAITAAFTAASLKDIVDVGDELNKLAQKTGFTVESLSALKYAGDLANVGVEDLSTGIKHLGNNMSAALGGSQSAQAIFTALGVSVKGAAGQLRSTESVLGDIADKFAGYEDGAAKAALATSLFGKNGTTLIPFLNQGREGLEQMRREAERFGVVMSSEFAAQAEAFNDNLTKINKTFEASKLLVAEELLPTLNQLAEAFLASREQGEKFSLVGETIRIGLETIAVVGATVADVLKGAGREIGAIAAQAVALATLDFQGFTAISDAVKADADKAAKELKDFNDRILRKGSFGTTGAPAFEEGFTGSATLSGKKSAPTVADPAAIKALDELLKKIRERGDAEREQIKLGRDLTDSERYKVSIMAELADAHNKVDAAGRKRATSEALSTIAAIKFREEHAKATQAMLDNAAAAQASIAAILKEGDARRDANKALGDQIEEIGLTANQLDDLRTKRLEAAKAQEELNLANARGSEASDAELAAMQQNIDLLQRQINLRRAGKAAQDRESNDPQRGAQRALDDYVDTAKKAGDAAEALTKKTAQGIEDGLTAGLTGGKFEVKTFVNEILAEIVRLSIVKPFLASIFGGASGAGIAGGIGSAVSGGFSGLIGAFFGGMFADGGTLGAGRWGIAGEAGPELIKGPASVVPLSGRGGYVDNRTVNNYIDANTNQAQIGSIVAGSLNEYDRVLMQRLKSSGVMV